jgi:hypothetical protein
MPCSSSLSSKASLGRSSASGHEALLSLNSKPWDIRENSNSNTSTKGNTQETDSNDSDFGNCRINSCHRQAKNKKVEEEILKLRKEFGQAFDKANSATIDRLTTTTAERIFV